MCGIGGIIKLENRSLHLGAGAVLLSRKLRHRGPDDEGFLFFGESGQLCAFGEDTRDGSRNNTFNFSSRGPVPSGDEAHQGVLVHRRLAILDVGPGGHQPMCTQNGRIWITYNGEIYNYVELRKELEGLGHAFRTQSDTEVLLNAYFQWGSSCLQRFNGMFAFAIWDQDRKQLFCARDRSGVKPFYYYLRNGVFCFASELKALRALPFVETGLNERALQHYLLHDAIEYEAEGFLKHVLELMPAHYLTLDLTSGRAVLEKYFEVQPESASLPFDERAFGQACISVRESVTDAVLKRLRADVPVGCCLSGGIDSSVIAGVIAGRNKHFNAFTATFPGEKIDESAYAAEAARLSGARWHTVTPTAQDLIADYEQMVYALDLPIWSTSTYAQFRVMRLAREHNIKVVLDGQGGDELFAGYPHYHTTFINELLKRGELAAASHEIRSLGNRFLLAFTRENAKRRLQYNANKRYLNPELVKAHTPPANLSSRFHALNEHLHYDFFGGRLKTYLRCEDRCSMHHSVESRTPFADDTALIGQAFALPAVFKIHNGVSKFILREAMKDTLPASVYRRKDKMGFVTPHNQWLGPLLASYRDLQHDPSLKNHFSKRFWSRFDHLSGKSNQLPNANSLKEENLVFKALTFSVWYKAFGF